MIHEWGSSVAQLGDQSAQTRNTTFRASRLAWCYGKASTAKAFQLRLPTVAAHRRAADGVFQYFAPVWVGALLTSCTLTKLRLPSQSLVLARRQLQITSRDAHGLSPLRGRGRRLGSPDLHPGRHLPDLSASRKLRPRPTGVLRSASRKPTIQFLTKVFPYGTPRTKKLMYTLSSSQRNEHIVDTAPHL